jgi:hypothetical protein
MQCTVNTDANTHFFSAVNASSSHQIAAGTVLSRCIKLSNSTQQQQLLQHHSQRSQRSSSSTDLLVVPYSDIGVRIGGLWIGPQAPVMHAISAVLRCSNTRTMRSNDSYRYFE